jgi:hypothetical protein
LFVQVTISLAEWRFISIRPPVKLLLRSLLDERLYRGKGSGYFARLAQA